MRLRVHRSARNMSGTARCRRAAREKAAHTYGSPLRVAATSGAVNGPVRQDRKRRITDGEDGSRSDGERDWHQSAERRGSGAGRRCAPAVCRFRRPGRAARRSGFTIRRATRIPAASASSPTSRAASRTRSSQDALTILLNLEHRGAVGADPRAGDGAGILVQIPHKFFARKGAALGFTLPAPGEYAIGLLFMPRDAGMARTDPQDLRRDRGGGRHDDPRLAHRHADRQFDARRVR